MSKNNQLSQHLQVKIPIHFLEPSSNLAREHFIYSRLRKLDDERYQELDTEEIKKQLKSIREDALKNLDENVGKLTSFLLVWF